MPFPNISAKLACQAHMYICALIVGREFRFVKCQTLKPYMLYCSPMKYYWDEKPNINRNPFTNETRIDCDKLFVCSGVRYDLRLRTARRPDVCYNIMEQIEKKLNEAGSEKVIIDSTDICCLNTLITME